MLCVERLYVARLLHDIVKDSACCNDRATRELSSLLFLDIFQAIIIEALSRAHIVYPYYITR